MGTVRGGSIICDKCGDECRSLYGFAITTDRISHSFNDNMKKIVDKIDLKYGKHDFILCWDCTIQMMGIPTLAEKKALADAHGMSGIKEGKTPEKDGTLDFSEKTTSQEPADSNISKEKSNATQKQK